MSVKNRKQASAPDASNGTPTQGNAAFQKAWSLIQRNDYSTAANLLASAGHDIHVRNALGVCMMRSGKVDQAVDLFRSFVLMPGSLIERPEVSNACKRNFATALLMKGLPSGAMSVLAETHDHEHMVAVRLYAAVKQWEQSLSWFRRLDWKLNGVEPSDCRVSIDFEPGEFDFEIQPPRPIGPVKPRKTASKLAA